MGSHGPLVYPQRALGVDGGVLKICGTASLWTSLLLVHHPAVEKSEAEKS